MLKIVVVDDEELIRKGLVKALSSHGSEFQVAGEAANGLEALELLRRTSPDVVVTDVKMPHMDGLELVKEMERSFPEIEKIVISGFGEFDFVRETMRDGALDYLLKPVDDEELVVLLKKISATIEQDKLQKLAKSQLQEKLHQGLPFIKEQMMLELLIGSGLSRADVAQKLDDCEITLHPGTYWVIIVSVDNYRRICREEGIEAAQGKVFTVKNCFEETLAQRHEILSCPEPGGRLYLISTPGEDPAPVLRMLEEALANLNRNAPEIRVTLSLGKPGGDLLNLQESYRQAAALLRQRFYRERSGIVSCRTPVPSAPGSNGRADLFSNALENLESALKNCLEIGDQRPVAGIFNEFAALLQKLRFDPAQVVKLFIEIYVRLQSVFPEFGKSLIELYGLEDCYPKTMESFDSLDVLIRYNIRLYAEAIAKTAELRNRKDKKLVTVVKEYIMEHYREPISLTTIAEITYLSPSYVSDLFKNLTGENITDYLAKARIEKAKTLLKDLQVKSYEIGEMVGYGDPAYFSKVFKKVVGVSPNEYRNIVT